MENSLFAGAHNGLMRLLQIFNDMDMLRAFLFTGSTLDTLQRRGVVFQHMAVIVLYYIGKIVVHIAIVIQVKNPRNIHAFGTWDAVSAAGARYLDQLLIGLANLCNHVQFILAHHIGLSFFKDTDIILELFHGRYAGQYAGNLWEIVDKPQRPFH